MEDKKTPLDKDMIRDRLGDAYSELPIYVYDVLDSTNLRALKFAEESDAERAVFIADSQTAGRGRLGRSFISPAGDGIYMSILTRPAGAAADAVAITAYAATVVRRAIEDTTGLKAKIKWVNDIYIDGKKLSGILTQGVIDTQSGTLTHAVMGVGINVYGKDLPQAISGIATTLQAETGRVYDRAELAARIISLYLDNIDKVGTKEIADEYREHSFLIGKDVRVIRADREYNARVIGITDKCELDLELESGEHRILATGEVSIRERLNN